MPNGGAGQAARERAWARTAAGEFLDNRKEQFAICRAKGMTIKASAEESKVRYETAIEQWAPHLIMKERVAQIQKQNPTTVLTLGMVIQDLKTNADEAREAGQYKASTEALMSLYKIMKEEQSSLDGGIGTPSLITNRQQFLAEMERAHRLKATAGPVPALDAECEELDTTAHDMNTHDTNE